MLRTTLARSLAFVCLLAVSGCASAPAARRFRASGPGATADGGARFTAPGVVFEVREIGDSERAGLVRAETGAPFDPFDVAKDGEPVFRTFVLEIRNTGSEAIEFNPSFTRLHIGEVRRYPLGFSEIYRLLSTAFGSNEALVMRFAPLTEETSISIRPGAVATRLLVFNRIPKKAKKAVLEMTGLSAASSAEVDVRIEFKRGDD